MVNYEVCVANTLKLFTGFIADSYKEAKEAKDA